MLVPAGVLNQGGFDVADDLNPSLWVKETGYTTSGNNVTVWANDGSLGGQFNASSYAVINSTHLNSMDVMTFFGASRYPGTSALFPILNNKSQFWFFYLYNQTNATGDEVICHITENVGTGSRQSILGGTSNFNSRFGGRRVDGSTFSSRTSAAAYNNVWTMMLGYNDYQAATVELWVNGVKEGPTTNAWGGGSANTPANNSAAVWIGQYANSTSGYNGHLAEIIAGDNSLSTGLIDKTFGYAAHKWGLTANLPAEHPYKSTPP